MNNFHVVSVHRPHQFFVGATSGRPPKNERIAPITDPPARVTVRKPPLCKGRWRGVPRRRDCLGAKVSATIPQSAPLTAPFTQGSLGWRHYRQMAQYPLNNVRFEVHAKPRVGRRRPRRRLERASAADLVCTIGFAELPPMPSRARQAARAPTRGAKSAQTPRIKERLGYRRSVSRALSTCVN